MSDRAPRWLAELQARFGAALRAPLDRATGTLRATPEAYDPTLCEAIKAPAHERLAVYQRQYWFRLLTVMQQALPLTTALIGAWELNGLAARFLAAHPPAGWDIDRVPDGFGDFLATLPDERARLLPQPGDPLTEAVMVDEAWREVLGAPAARPFQPSAAEAARLPTSRLLPSPSVHLLTERRPLLELRQALARGDEGEVTLPPPSERPRSWAVARSVEGLRSLPLEEDEAALLRLLREHPVSEALGLFEGSRPEAERAALPQRAQRWLGRSAQIGMWAGLVAD